jgi:xanthine dehydrogenase accessory factor
MKSLLQIIRRVSSRPKESWALATLVRTRGSTYRKPGARLLVDKGGRTTGVLSGGCLESEIAQYGLRVIKTGQPDLATFDTRRLYGCEGELDILVEPLPAAGMDGNLITRLGEHLERRERCCIRTVYEGSTRGSELLKPNSLHAEREGTLLHAVPLPVRLVLIGDGPEAPMVRVLGEAMAWIVEQFAHPSEVPDEFAPDLQTAAVVMTHHFGRDFAALVKLLPLNLPYVGLLGPRRRFGEMIARYQEFCSLENRMLDRLHAPAGLDIGSEAPEEIALSIVSEVAAVLAGRSGGCLRDRNGAIHEKPVRIIEKMA